MDRLFEALGAILDFADDRSKAWAVAAGAAIATISSWLFGLSRPILVPAAAASAYAPLTSLDRLLGAVAVFAPFVLVNAAWLAVAPTDAAAKTSENYHPLTGQYVGDVNDKRRRRLLAAAFAGVLNGFGMYIATH